MINTETDTNLDLQNIQFNSNMDGRFNNPFSNNQEDSENTSDNSGELPFSSSSGATPPRTASVSSQKRSRRAVQKRIVTVSIGDVEGSRIKGDGAPPYDSWAWRKYGQKPIKGSPYPRGYYRCSSSKGCPARKQVERSRVDPSMLVITYACDHNHSGPPSRNPNTAAAAATPTIVATDTVTTIPITPKSESEMEIYTTQSETEDKFADLAEESLINTEEFTWFSDVETVLESPIYSGMNREGDGGGGGDVAMIFPMGEEDESLFADLGELPECSVVFQRGFLLDQERRRRCSLRAG